MDKQEQKAGFIQTDLLKYSQQIRNVKNNLKVKLTQGRRCACIYKFIDIITAIFYMGVSGTVLQQMIR